MHEDDEALFRRRRREVSYALSVRDKDGVHHRLDNKFGREWVKSIKITEDIDQPSMTLDVELQREWEAYSLSPLIYNSRFNTETVLREFDGDNKPLLELDNRIYVWVSLQPEGLFSEAWMNIFSGRISSVDPSGATIKLLARDAGHDLVTAWIKKKEEIWGTVEGQPVEEVMESILHAWGIGVALYVPKSPNWLVKQFKQERMPLYEAMQNIYIYTFPEYA